MNHRLLLVLLVLGLGVATRVRADSSAIPAWVLEAAARPTPSFAENAPTLTLLDEWAYEVLADGQVVHTRRFAMRVLNRGGNERARASVGYLDKREKVIAATVWLVRAGKEIRPAKRREWADVSNASEGAIYDESRSRAINYEDLAVIGDVFAFETRVERRLLFGQFFNYWNAVMPTLVDRCVLRLAPGWSCEVVKDGNELGLLRETISGQTYTWEMHDRPYRRDEPAMATGARRDAVVRINLVPPVGATGPFPFVPRDWAAVANWDWNNAAGQCDTDPALAAAAQKLTAGCADPLARMRALSRYVQQLRYVGVNKNLALGAGYRPRKATEVHAKGWGDCKDKANLLVAMLREAGIEAFIVTAQAGGGKLINPAWPSLLQFNHAIVGIRVDESVQLPTVGEVVGLGRLLFFDPTDPDVLLGDLPWVLQGTKVYVVAPGTTGLTVLPKVPAAIGHRHDTLLTMTLAASGALVGECEFGGGGSIGAEGRGVLRRTSAKDVRANLETWVNESVRGGRLDSFESTDDLVSGVIRDRFTFSAPKFGQQMPGGLMLVRLDVVNRRNVPSFSEKERKLPIEIEPFIWHDEMRLNLPSSLTVDEIPDPTEVITRFGTYRSRVETVAGAVVVHRDLVLEECVVSAGEYGELRKFLTAAAKADRFPIVLRAVEGQGASAP